MQQADVRIAVASERIARSLERLVKLLGGHKSPKKPEGKLYVCESCGGREFHNPQALLIHQRMKHPNLFLPVEE